MKSTAHPPRGHDPRRFHHPDFDKMQARGWKAAEAEAKIGNKRWKEELERGLRNGLTGADSITDKSGETQWSEFQVPSSKIQVPSSNTPSPQVQDFSVLCMRCGQHAV